jgi:hypothetical protein
MLTTAFTELATIHDTAQDNSVAHTTSFVFLRSILILSSKYSSVGIATGYGLDDRGGTGVRVPVG